MKKREKQGLFACIHPSPQGVFALPICPAHRVSKAPLGRVRQRGSLGFPVCYPRRQAPAPQPLLRHHTHTLSTVLLLRRAPSPCSFAVAPPPFALSDCHISQHQSAAPVSTSDGIDDPSAETQFRTTEGTASAFALPAWPGCDDYLPDLGTWLGTHVPTYTAVS